MATWVFCNRCFQPPHRKSSFSLTSCGHVYCEDCLRRGKKDECLICKVPCRTVLLSKHTDANIQAFFMGIDGLCKKYSQETFQISEFQEKHRRRLSTFYREKISQLEESLRKAVVQMERLQSMRSSQQTAFSTIKSSVSTKPDGRLLVPPHSAASGRVESMEVDPATSPGGRPDIAMGPTRISLISPPQNGRMGCVSCRGPQHPSLTPSHSTTPKALRVPPLQVPHKLPSSASASPFPGRVGQGSSPGPPRPPISIAGLLRRPYPEGLPRSFFGASSHYSGSPIPTRC